MDIDAIASQKKEVEVDKISKLEKICDVVKD